MIDLPKVRIESGERVGQFKVFINDAELGGVTNITIDMGVEEIPLIKISFLAGMEGTNDLNLRVDSDE